VEIQGTPIRIKVVSAARLFGTRRVWRGQVPVLVSDPSHTVVDLLDDPPIGGGIRHVAEVVNEYFKGEHRDDRQIVDYSKKLRNRTVYKRLGFLIEELGIDLPDLVEICRREQSSGLSDLDPSIPVRGRIVSRWNLRANADLLRNTRHDRST
jgi:predicted transcriptional regulator of viral defense system